MCRTVDVSATFQKAIDYFYLYVHMEKKGKLEHMLCCLYENTQLPFPRIIPI